MGKKRKWSRLLSFLLAAVLILGDHSLQYVMAAGSVSGADAAIGQTAGTETDEAGKDSSTLVNDEAENGQIIIDGIGGGQANDKEKPRGNQGLTDVSAGDMTVSAGDLTVSGGNIPLRQPEDYHEDPAPEDYGTLAAYDEYSRTYHVDGNQYVTVIGYDGATYLDEEGKLQDVDNTLVENPASVFSSIGAGPSYVNSSNDYRVQLNAGLDVSGGDLLTVTDGEHLLALAPAEGDFRKSAVKDNAIRYNNVLPQVDYQYTVVGNSIKEDIILLGPDAPNMYSYGLNTYGLEAVLLHNTLYLYEEGADPEQDAVFVLEAPEMEDAAGEISFGVKMELAEEDGGNLLVTVTADEEWLSASERVYPVRIDPTAIQVPKSAIHVACAEEGSPNSVIGDNSYPYVGYDDGLTSGNLAGFGSKHLNCRSYFQVDYGFAALAEEPEIVSAAFQVTQKTRWSKGTSEFGLYGVEEDWQVKRLSWNSQLGFNHYFLDSQTASTARGQALSYDVTEEVSAWINGTAPNHGFVMKAMVEAPNEAAGDLGVSMQCEVFYNNSSASYAPKLIVSWTGELTDLDSLTLDDTTIDIYPVVERNGDKSSNTLGVAAHGLAKPGSTVHYQLVNGASGEVEAEKKLVYPDSDLYAAQFPSALDYKRRLSNWQSEVFAGLTPGQVYYVTAYAEGIANDVSIPGTAPVYGTGITVTSDAFLIYEEGAFDLMPRIASHYGVELDTILGDMRMQDCLTREGNLIFIRNPQNTSAYTSGDLNEFYKAIIDGLLLGRAEHCEFGYEPINLNTGNFYMEQTDAAIPDIGGDFGLTRQYNSKGAGYKGSLGYGWTFAYDERLGELADGSVLWIRSNGGIMTFSKTGDGYAAPAGYDYTLAEAEGGYTVTELEQGTQHVFNTYGLLTALVDVQGNRTNMAYDMDFHLKNITSPSGKVITVALDGEDRITDLTLPDGYGISYGYDEAGNLVSVTDQAGTAVRYVYDEAHRMTQWFDENGSRVVLNEYDGEGRVIRQTDAEGAVAVLAYESAGPGQGGHTAATDAQGNTTVYHYDNQYRTTLIEYPDGTEEEKTYNDLGYPASVKDRMGAVTSYTYDANGNRLTETRQDGASRTWTYNGKNQVTSVTDFDGGVTSYGYDGANRLVTVKDAEDGTSTYIYDDSNRPVSITDARGGTSLYAYDGACVTSVTDPMGNTWQYTYDAMNRQLTAADPLGGTAANTYDARGRLTAVSDAAGGVISYVYDPAGTVTAITDKEGGTSTFTYDKMNRMLTGKDPLGNTLSYSYDGNGSRLTETDGEGQTVTYAYDPMNRISSVTDPEGLITAYAYDGGGHVVSVTDRRGSTASAVYDPVKKVISAEMDKLGGQTVYETDSCGRTTKITYPDGSSIRYTWDKLSRMTSITDQLGMVTELSYDASGNVTAIREEDSNPQGGIGRSFLYEYDALNRLVKTTDPLGNSTVYTYDALGSLLTVTDGRGSTTSYAYDALSRVTGILDALGGETTYSYDKEGRPLKITAPEGNDISYEYDAIGQLISETDALGGATRYSYDGVSRLTGRTDALKGVTSYTYDKNGHMASMTDALGNVHLYAVDGEGSLLTDTYPNGEKESYTYDVAGNPLTYTDRSGVVTTFTYDAMGRILKASDTAGNEMTYTYDGAGNLLAQTDVLGRTASYEYDAFGRPVAVTGIDGMTTRYEYDALDRLVKVTDGEGKATAYGYDASGNLVHTTEPGEAEYAYTYDALNRLTRKIDPLGAATVFVYDKNSNLTQVEDGNGVATSYAYDALNRLSRYTDGNGGETGYSYDPLSRLTRVTTPEGLTEQYSYDAMGNMLSVTDGLGQTTRYSYDRLYRLIGSTSPMGAVEKYTYDSHDVVTSVTDALGGVTLYEVNDNGQVTKKTQANGGVYRYTYDAVQRLTGITTPLGYETAFAYNDGNDLLSQTDNLASADGAGRTTVYSYDAMHRLTAVTDPEGGVTQYGYDERGNRSAVTDALGYTYSFAYDKVDRMTTVADPEDKAASFAYDMVGNLTAVTAPGGRTTSYSYDRNYNITAITDPKGYQYGYTYDKDDRLTSALDPLGQTERYTYDDAGRLTSWLDKMGLTEGYAYDAHGNVLQKTAADGLVTTYTYDLLDRMTSLTDPMGSKAYYTYDSMGNLTGVADYMGRGTAYTYDLEGNLTSIMDQAGRTETMAYDVSGRLISYTSNGGNRITYDYDKLNDLVEKSYTDAEGKESARPVQYAYNGLGQRVDMSDSTGETEYTYDGLGRITGVTTCRTQNKDGSVNLKNGDPIGYTYDEADNLSAVLYPDGTKVSYEYDKNDNLTRVTGRRGEVTSYEYDALNRVTEMHRPNGISTYNTYNARDQIISLVNQCDHCGWVLSSYTYTYDDRGFIAAEHAEEAQEADPYGRDPHVEYKPGRLSKDCSHGKSAGLSYRLVKTDRTFTYDDAGKLLAGTEAVEGCGTTRYEYAYDLMGNRTSMTKKNSLGFVVESRKFVYNESSQMVESMICDGRKTQKWCYTYDEDGNLVSECTPNDPGQSKTYEYSVEDRLEAVYNRDTLLMAAAYDGDGNRVFQLNYNPEKDEDFTDYYNTYSNGSYTGTGILFPVCSEVSDAEQDLMDKIYPGQGGKYELTEYLNDVNREYAEVLVEQNLNGKTDTVYTYGAGRISSEQWNCAGNTSYYLYNPRGDVTGLANQKGQLCRTYQYSAYGEITFGASAYENEYTYNGESYNPNIKSQYLRARYYNVVTANFLTEDSCLGRINEPLTLNRYTYCVANPVNYRDPSGHMSSFLDELFDNFINNTISTILKNWSAINEFTESELSDALQEQYEQNVESQRQGITDSFIILIGSVAKPATAYINGIGPQSTFSEELEKENRKLDTYLQYRAESAGDMTSYYAGRCIGDAAQQIISVLLGNAGASQGGSITVTPQTSLSGRDILALHNGVALELNYGKLLAGALVGASTSAGLVDFYKSSQKLGGTGGKRDSETGNWNKGSFDSPEDSLDYHYGRHGDEVGATSRDQYLRKAEEFAKTAKKGSTKSRVDGAVEGTIRYKKNGKYIDIAPDGSIVSFGKQ